MPEKIICMRCRGIKKLYKVGSAYSAIDTGGVKVDCPMCLGEGKILPLSAASDEVKKKVKSSRKNIKTNLKIKDKDDIAIEPSNSVKNT